MSEVASILGLLLLAGLLLIGTTRPRRRLEHPPQPPEEDPGTHYRDEQIEAINALNEAITDRLERLERILSEQDNSFRTPRESDILWALGVLDMSPRAAADRTLRRKIYAKAMKTYHPDHGGSSEDLIDAMKAWDIILETYGEKNE